MKKRALGFSFALASSALVACAGHPASDSSEATEKSVATETSAGGKAGNSALDAVKALIGTYTGESQLYALDANGSVQPTIHFHESIVVGEPVEQNGKAFAPVEDTMTYSDPHIPQQKIEWNEGFYVNPDGTAGAHYFRTTMPPSPADVIEMPIGGEAVTFDADVTKVPYILEGLGFSGKDRTVTYAKQTTVKNVVKSATTETDVITQFSTVIWTDAAGASHTSQFVSLNGYQSREIATH
jgi:hypothetical protein